jgi:hypothetical protein
LLLVECRTITTASLSVQDELQRYVSDMFNAGWRLDKYSTSAIDSSVAATSEAVMGPTNVTVYHSFIWIKEAVPGPEAGQFAADTSPTAGAADYSNDPHGATMGGVGYRAEGVDPLGSGAMGRSSGDSRTQVE